MEKRGSLRGGVKARVDLVRNDTRLFFFSGGSAAAGSGTERQRRQAAVARASSLCPKGMMGH